MGTNRDITSVQKSTICIHKYVFTQTYTIPMIAMERRAHNGCLRYSRYQVFQQSSVSLIVSTQLPHPCQQLLGIFKLYLYFRGRHIRQLRTTHFLYFIHIFQLPDYTLKSVIIHPFTITLSTKIDIYSKQLTILIKRNSKYFQNKLQLYYFIYKNYSYIYCNLNRNKHSQ